MALAVTLLRVSSIAIGRMSPFAFGRAINLDDKRSGRIGIGRDPDAIAAHTACG